VYRTYSAWPRSSGDAATLRWQAGMHFARKCFRRCGTAGLESMRYSRTSARRIEGRQISENADLWSVSTSARNGNRIFKYRAAGYARRHENSDGPTIDDARSPREGQSNTVRLQLPRHALSPDDRSKSDYGKSPTRSREIKAHQGMHRGRYFLVCSRVPDLSIHPSPVASSARRPATTCSTPTSLVAKHASRNSISPTQRLRATAE
jgi:hypothetical protein